MPKSKIAYRLRKRWPAYVALLVITFVLAWFLGRCAMVSIAYMPDNPVYGFMQQITGTGFITFFQHIVAEPFNIDLSNKSVLLMVIVGVVVPIIFGFMGMGHVDPDVENAGTEHGTSRLATKKEMPALKDKKKERWYNNIIFSENTGFVLYPFNKKLSRTASMLNQNSLCLGMSGQGKTFTCVAPDIMQACGDALPPLWFGAGNLLFGAKRSRDAKRVVESGRPLVTLPLPTNAGPAEIARTGYDFVNTDPKGVNLNNFGPMLVAAGFEIYSLNTIDVTHSDRYNPLAFIPLRDYDIVEPRFIRCSCALSARNTAGEFNLQLKDQVRDNTTCAVSANNIGISMGLKFESSFSGLTIDESLQKKASENTDEEFVVNTVCGFSYKSTKGVLTINLYNHTDSPLSGTFEIDLGPWLDVLGQHADADGKVGFKCTTTQLNEAIANGGKLTCSFEDVEPWTEFPHSFALAFDCRIKRASMPDGVQLLKTVECLSSQLQTDSKDLSDSSFWSRCAELNLCGAISYQFEALPKRYHNLATTVELVDLMVPEEGDTVSAFDVLLKQWETGKRYRVPTGKDNADIVWAGSSDVESMYEDTGIPPHHPSISLALHCFNAIKRGEDKTFRSVVITTQSFFARICTPEMRWLLGDNELPMDCLGEPGQRRALFLISSDSDHTYDFLLSMVVFQLLNLHCDKSARTDDGKLVRHVRFVLDEVMNLGKISILERAIAVTRSRNISVALFCQSKDRIEQVYGEHGYVTLVDNCTTMIFMGSQHEGTLDMISKRVGTRTAKTRVFQNSFPNAGPCPSVSESVTSTEAKVIPSADLDKTDKEKMLVFQYSEHAALDYKFKTERHPYYAYCYPKSNHTRRRARFVFGDNYVFDFNMYKTKLIRENRPRIPFDALSEEGTRLWAQRGVYWNRGEDGHPRLADAPPPVNKELPA